MGDSKLKAAILIISDTAFNDPSTDRAGGALRDTFSTDGNEKWDEPTTKIVPDDVLEIQRIIQQWCDSADFYNLVVTTGGTGFAVKDSTPEVCEIVLTCKHLKKFHRHHGRRLESIDSTIYLLC